MKITIENTEKIVELNGVPARIWEGETDSGIKVRCFITRVIIDITDKTNEQIEQYKRELLQVRPPSVEVEAYPLKLIL